MKILFTIPEELYKEFIKSIPNGERSSVLSTLIKQHLNKSPQKRNPLNDLKKYRKGDYSHEDPIKITKDAWKNFTS